MGKGGRHVGGMGLRDEEGKGGEGANGKDGERGEQNGEGLQKWEFVVCALVLLAA